MAMKRPAAAMKKAGEPKGKKAKTAKASKKTTQVTVCRAARMLLEKGCAGFEKSLLKFLASNLESLFVPKAERSDVFDALIAKSEEVLDAIVASNQTVVDNSKAELNELSGQKEQREAAVGAADAEITKLAADLEAATAAHTEGVKAMQEATKAFKAAEKEQKDADAVVAKQEKQKATLDACVATELVTLKEKATAESNKVMKAFIKVCKENSFDPLLLESVQAVFVKAPDARSGFDAVVLEQLDGALAAAAASLTSALASSGATKAEHTAKADAAKAGLEAATAAETSQQEAAAAADKALKAGTQAVAAAKKAVKTFDAEVKAARSTVDHSEEFLEKVTKVATNFKDFVKSFDLPEEPEAPAEAETEAPAAPAEAAAEVAA